MPEKDTGAKFAPLYIHTHVYMYHTHVNIYIHTYSERERREREKAREGGTIKGGRREGDEKEKTQTGHHNNFPKKKKYTSAPLFYIDYYDILSQIPLRVPGRYLHDAKYCHKLVRS